MTMLGPWVLALAMGVTSGPTTAMRAPHNTPATGVASAAAAGGPVAWWRFEDPSTPGKSSGSATAADLTFPSEGNPGAGVYTVETSGGCVGSYLDVRGNDTGINVSASTTAPLPSASPAPGITVEFLIKLNPTGYFNLAGNTTVLSSGHGDDRWTVVLDRHALGLRAAGRVLSVPLNGAPPASYFYLTDASWHHVAMRIDGKTGEAALWVDGQCPDGFRIAPNASSAPGTVPNGGPTSVVFLPTAFDGAIDEVAVWAEALTNSTIYTHYHTAVVEHKPYPLSPSTAPVPPPPPSPANPYDLTDFAPGTTLPTPIGNATLGVTATPTEQLKEYPAPRFLASPATGKGIGKLQRNFNWGAPNDYMAGSPYNYYIDGPKRAPENESALVVAGLQEELATTWNYNLNFVNLGRPSCKGPSVDKKGNPIPASCDVKTQAMINLSNANPTWGIDTIFQRMGSRYCADPTNRSTCEKSWRFTNQTLPDGCYFQDAKGKFLTLTGAHVNMSNPKSLKVLRPTTSAGATKNGCPDSLFRVDYVDYRTNGLLKKYGGLKQTVSRINNDGEYDVIYMCAASLGVFSTDPVIAADYATSGIPKLPSGDPDWPSFASRWRARFSNQFSDALTSDPESPELKGALFSEYQVQGTNLFFGNWNETRKINTPIENGGVLRYYSTGDIYPWVQQEERFMIGPYKNKTVVSEGGTPSWDVTHGSWHGVDWLAQILPGQISTGDTIWSPFVAAGWSEREELNARPGQWLGQLKLLTVTGAEFFNMGFFSLHPPFPDARNWVWQAAAPVYAQAITSHWLDVLYNGELLMGDMPIPPISCQVMQADTEPMQWVPAVGVENCQAPAQPYVSYRFWAGSQSIAVFVRKLKGEEKYVIAGTVQPESNIPTNAPLSVTATIHLPNGPLKMEIRRQGSVYIFENSTKPTLTQVDTWHEASHFSRWSKDIVVEAELHDEHAIASPWLRETEQPLDAAPHDFSRFTTFVSTSLNASSPPRSLTFSIQPRATAQGINARYYQVQVRYRQSSSGGPLQLVAASSTDIVTADLESSMPSTSTSTVWQFHTFAGQLRVATDSPQEMVVLTAMGSGWLHLDQIRLVEV